MTEPRGTRVTLGGLKLARADFSISWYCGADLRTFVIRQPIGMLEALAALPYNTTLLVEASVEPKTAKPAHSAALFENLRILEVRQVDSKVCEVHIGHADHDVARFVCPMDFNIAFRDGYLHRTDFPALTDAIEELKLQRPALESALSPAWADQIQGLNLPDGLPLSGSNLLVALNELAESTGARVSRDQKGLSFARNSAVPPEINLEGYNWAQGFTPSWTMLSRIRKGRAAMIRVLYRERHARRIPVENPRETSSEDGTLKVQLQQAFEIDGEIVVGLYNLLRHFGFSGLGLSNAQVAAKINSRNFENTIIEALGQYHVAARRVIEILKRDWRMLWQVLYPDGTGRQGGWEDEEFGAFVLEQDKDGKFVARGTVTARAVAGEHTVWLGVAQEDSGTDQRTLEGAIVARSYVSRQGQGELSSVLPDTPYTATWVNRDAGVLRFTPGTREASASHVWMGRMNLPAAKGLELRTERRDFGVDDKGVPQGNTAGLHFPTPEEVKFTEQLRAEVFMVATRRLPNSDAKWTAIEIPTPFEEAELDVMELEVGDEMFALRDYVGGSGGTMAQPDGLGELLNEADLKADAARRVAVVIDRMNAPAEGEGAALGTAAAEDMVCGLGIREIRLEVTRNVVRTVVSVGDFDDEAARQKRARLHEQSRKVVAGGRTITGPTGGPEVPELPEV